MTNLDTKKRRHKGKKFLLLCLMSFGSLVGLHAQKATWTAGYPQTNPSPVITTEVGYIQVSFTPTGSDISNAKVEVNLPTGVSYDGSTAVMTGHTNSAISSATEAGGKLTVNFTGNTLTKDKLAAFQVRIKTTCEFTSGTATIQVLSGSTPVPDENNANAKAVTVYAQQPDFSVTAPTGTESQEVANLNQDATFTLNIKVTNGTASSLKLTFTTDQYLTLSSFSMSGVTITQPTATGTTTKTWEVTLPTTFNNTTKTLTFKAKTSRSGSRSINVAYQYPSTGTACVSGNSKDLVLTRHSTNVGIPVVTPQTITWVASDLTTALNNFEVPVDGSTPGYAKVAYSNSNVADAYDLRFQATITSNHFPFGYFDHTGIKYQIGSGAIQDFPAANVTMASRINSAGRGNIILKPAVSSANPPYSIYLNLSEVLGKGEKVTFYIPTLLGAIYDNSANTKDVTLSNVNWWVMNHIRSYVSRVNTEDGNSGTAGAFGSNTAYTVPRITGAAEPVSIRPTDIGSATINVNAGTYQAATATVTTPQTTSIFFKLPAWLTLKDGNVSTAVEWGGTALPATSVGSNTYYVTTSETATRDLTINLEVAPAYQGATVNMTDNIEYWVNYNVGLTDNVNRNTRPVLERISQVFQSVTLMAEVEGFTFTDFALRRTTIGFKDDDNNGIPDDGTYADPDAATFRHDLFYLNDNGKIVIKGTVAGVPTDTYQNMYILMSSADLNMNTGINWSAGTIKVNNTLDATSIELVRVTDLQYYFLFKKTLKGGDLIEIEVPFIAKSASTAKRSIKTEVYMTVADENYSGATVFNNPANRLGKEFESGGFAVGTTSTWFNGDNWPKKTFSNNNKNTIDLAITYSSTAIFGTPYESRQLFDYKRFEVDIPEGYEVLATDNFILDNRNSGNNNSVINSLAQTKSIVLKESYPYSNANGSGTTYVYDLTTAFDPGYTDANPSSTLWPPIDELYYYYHRLPIKATKGAKKGNTNTQLRIVFDDKIAANPNSTLTSNLIWTYTGDGTAISTGLTSVPAYGKTLTIPAVRVENPNDKTIGMWLYVAGNVSNITFKSGSSTINPVAGSFEGRWFNLSNFTNLSYNSYDMTFDYGGATDCSGDEIIIYTVSNFGAAWSPTTTATLNLTDTDHVGAYKKVTITTAPASIAGTMSMSNVILEHNVLYTLDATIDARGSAGLLSNAQMSITIPAGQKYEANSATIEYPVGTKVPVAATVESQLLSGNSNITAERTFVFNVGDCLNDPNFMFSGNQETGVTDAYRQATLQAGFRPQCETRLTGIRFLGNLSGTDACGTVSHGTARTALTPIIFSDVVTDYSFDITAGTKTGIRAFNEIQGADEVVITMRKKANTSLGNTLDMPLTDYMSFTLPASMDITTGGYISISSTISGVPATATINSNTVADGVRTISVALPISQINNDIVKGIGKDIVYTIPVTYTLPTDGAGILDVKNKPEKTIEVTLLSEAKFSGTCSVQPISIGYASIGIALVKAKENPASTCKNDPIDLAIESVDFSGKWYSDASKTQELSATADLTYTPTTAQNVDLYVSAIFNNNDYGLVPVRVNVHPELLVDFTNDDVCSGTPAVLTSTITVGGTPDPAKISSTEWYKDGEATSFSILPSPSVTLAVGTHSITLKVTSIDGCVESVTKNVIVHPAPVANFTAQTPVCENTQLTFTSTSTVASGSITKYEWSFGDGSTAETTTNTTNHAYTTSGSFTAQLTVTTASGCSATKTSTMVVYAQPTFTLATAPAICNGKSLNLNDLVSNVSSNSTVKFYSNATATTEVTNTIVSPTTTTNYYAKSINSVTGCESEIKQINVVVNAIPAAPTVTSPVTYCQDDAAVALTATGSNLKWYDAGETALTGGAPTPSTTVAGNTTYKVTQTNANGCESPMASIIVTVNALPALPGVTSPVVYCQGSTATALTATASSGNTLVWYDTNNNPLSSAPTPITTAAGNTTYKVSQKTSAGCESPKASITVTINELPAAPVATTTISYCQNAPAVALSATATGTNTLKWYTATDVEITTGAPTPGTATVGNTIYKVSQISTSGCESTKTVITVTVTALPAAPAATTTVSYCQNAVAVPLTATALAGNTLQWYEFGGNPLAGAPTPVTTAPGTTTYKVSQKNGNSCESAQTTITVTVNALPALPGVTSPVVYCQGSTATALTATPTSGNTLAWYDDNNNPLGSAPTPITTAAGNTTYKVSQKTGVGCESPKAAITVTINELPAAPVTTTAISYCQNAPSVALSATATGTNTLKWYTATDVEITTGAPTPGTTAVGNTIYKVSQISTSGCESTKTTITVTVTALPAAPVATTTVSYCQNAVAVPLTATAIAGNTLQWYESGGNPLAGAPTPVTTAPGTTTYKVSQKNSSSCESAQTTITVTVNTLPALPGVSSPVVYCQGSAATALTATPTSGNTLAWYDANENPLGSAPTPITTAAGNTTYKVSQKTGAGCESPKASITVTINELPAAPVATTTISYCQNASAVALTATTTGTNTLKWYTATDVEITTGAPTPNTTTAGSTTYKVSQISLSGCESAKTNITVTVHALPTAPIASSPVVYCQNAVSVPLSATALNGNTLRWYDASGAPLTSGAPIPNTAVAGSTIYKVSQVSSQGCESAQTSITVTINALPSINIGGISDLCVNSSLTLTSGTSGGSGVWSSNNSSVASITNTGIVTANKSGSFQISYTHTDANGCINSQTTDSYTVNALPTPTITTPITDVCEYSSNTIYDAPAGMTNYQWTVTGGILVTTNDNEAVVDWGAASSGNGTISINYTDSNGCTATSAKTYTVRIKALPDATFNMPATSVCQGSSITLSAINKSGTWSDNGSTFGTINSSGVFSATSAGSVQITYTVTENGCTSSSDQTLTINALPTVVDISSDKSSVCPGEDFQLTLDLTGQSPWSLSYNDGTTTTKTTATSSPYTLTIPGIQGTTTYQVVNLSDANTCSNSSSDVTSSSATITLDSPVEILAQPVNHEYCPGIEEITFSVEAQGTNLSYQWHEYDATNESWTSVGTDSPSLTYAPEDSKENQFYVTITGKCSTIDSKTVTSREKVQVIEQKRNHTLVVNNNPTTNGGHNFTYYYWYKDDEQVHSGGSDAGNYYTGGINLDPQSTYYAILLDDQNQQYTTCGYTPIIKSGVNIIAYPNPTSVSQGDLTVEVESGSQLWEGAQIETYNAIGLKVGETAASGPTTTVKMPGIPGAYILKYISGETIREIKVIVK